MIHRRGLLALAAALAPSLALAQDVKPDEVNRPGPLGDVILGKPEAKVTVIEYASTTCPHCRDFHTKTLPEFKAKYVETGLVRFIPREFPLDPIATAGFMLARCAGGDDRFTAMLDLLYAGQEEIVTSAKPVDALMAVARQAGFTKASFDACLNDKKTYEAVTSVKARGAKEFGIDSTPTFFIDGTRHRGTLRMEDFDRILTPLLKAS